VLQRDVAAAEGGMNPYPVGSAAKCEGCGVCEIFENLKDLDLISTSSQFLIEKGGRVIARLERERRSARR